MAGQGAAAESRLARPAGHGRARDGAQGVGDDGRAPVELRHRQGEVAEQGNPLRHGVRVLVGLESFVEQREGKFVQPQRAFHGIGVDALDERPPPDQDARLPAAEQLVAGESHQVRAASEQLLRRRLAGQAETPHVHQGAAAGVHHDGKAVAVGDRRQFADGNGAREAAHPVVARVRLEQQRGVFADGVFVVAFVRAVGRADFAQTAAGAFHHLGQSERAADLDEFAARDRHFPAQRQGVQRQQHRGGVVVDHRGGFRAGEQAQTVGDDSLPVAAPPGGEVELQGDRPGGGLQRGLRDFRRKKAAAKIAVYQHAGEIEHRLVAVAHMRSQPPLDGRGVAGGGRRPSGRIFNGAGSGLQRPHGLLHGCQPPASRQRVHAALAQHVVDAGQLAARHGRKTTTDL